MTFTTASSQYTTVTTSSQKFTNAMVVGQLYRLHSTVDCLYKIGATGDSASAAAGSHALAAGATVYIETKDATLLGFVSVIRASTATADGQATLSLMEAR